MNQNTPTSAGIYDSPQYQIPTTAWRGTDPGEVAWRAYVVGAKDAEYAFQRSHFDLMAFVNDESKWGERSAAPQFPEAQAAEYREAVKPFQDIQDASME